MTRRKPTRSKPVYLLDAHHEALTRLADREHKTMRQAMDDILEAAFKRRKIEVKS